MNSQYTFPNAAAVAAALLLAACSTSPSTPPTPPAYEASFDEKTIADSVAFLWAHAPGDLTGDGIADLVFVSNNARGGYLGYFKGDPEQFPWEEIVVAEHGPEGETLAQGDLELADIDADGDLDIIAAEHPGEWDASTEDSWIYWYENPSWEPHFVGTTPDFVKDFSLVDLDKDGMMEVAALTFESSSLSIFRQGEGESWERIQYWEDYGNLHEGMHVGDVDGDGWADLVADAHVFFNPKGNLSGDWLTGNIDAKWNSQEGDWSRNGTKVFARNLDSDPEYEVFISHSERLGFPVSVYDRTGEGSWQETVIVDSLAACHTLQSFDFNNDGSMDLLTGMNRSRGKGLGFDSYPVSIHFATTDGTWKSQKLHDEGIYNGQVFDFDGDGDMDIFSYQTHDATSFQLMVQN